MKINKYNWLTNELLASYNTIQEAVFGEHVCYGTIYRQLEKPVLEVNRGRNFYFGYEPKKRWLIECYDNETRELLGVYSSVKEASEKTGVLDQHISYQCRLNKPFNKRTMGCTGLWFVKKLYD